MSMCYSCKYKKDIEMFDEKDTYISVCQQGIDINTQYQNKCDLHQDRLIFKILRLLHQYED